MQNSKRNAEKSKLQSTVLIMAAYYMTWVICVASPFTLVLFVGGGG